LAESRVRSLGRATGRGARIFPPTIERVLELVVQLTVPLTVALTIALTI
jgi:hypothetical protein